ncbi:imidazole glycerol phosphate synthase subunit HisH [Fictibacillus phosphorivorans]|uniref:imidazole glycerol phosphate synthase subunit HisH n=1 Tax=Fictibacillus phosphorivorans TaxID=1221500 RepID=UPI00203C8E26|nr:imidazole glycerol phosphate synthase subunit HisH [Fictibacillus phosphorivorans]MCM3718268.1 imidazole glycerol phosphate synthase subunit HisH [Fictibacillus phosphorivorans]MCM3775866.1 imidazole glycerol phosphate synthase subunit HisH [Fictibacillus phosphorivorans]
MIGIIDYGMGNLHSVCSALKRIDQPYILSGNPEELHETDGLLLPGVGSFKDAMNELQETGLIDFIKKETENGKTLMGICLGMQLLFEESTENGLTKGLGLLPGRVERFNGVTAEGKTYKVPHMGWNNLHFLQKEQPLLTGLDEGYVYFVHSYVVQTEDRSVLAAAAHYEDVEVPAVVGRGQIMGTQFHPEKSSETGMGMLKNFCRFVEEGNQK